MTMQTHNTVNKVFRCGFMAAALLLAGCTAVYQDTVKAPTEQEVTELREFEPNPVLKRGTFHMQRVSDTSPVRVEPEIRLKRPELPPFDVVYISQPVEDILIELANTAGESIVIPSSVRGRTVTVIHSGSNFKGMLDIVLSKVGYHYNYVDGVWYITRFPVRNYKLEISQSIRGGSLNTALEAERISSDADTESTAGGSIEELATNYEDVLWEQVDDTLTDLVGVGSDVPANASAERRAAQVQRENASNTTGVTTSGGVSAATGAVVGQDIAVSELIPEEGFAGDGVQAPSTISPVNLPQVQSRDHLSADDLATPFYRITRSAGIITVRAAPESHRLIETYLEEVQYSLLRQIFVEARILAIVKDKTTNRGGSIAGSDLNLGLAAIGGSSDTFGFSGLPAVPTDLGTQTGGFLNFTLNNNNLQTVVQMLNQVGDVYTISSPSLLARNNQISRVAITQQIGFAETTVETNTNADGNVVIGQRTDEARFRNAGTVFSIMPFVGKNNVQMRMRLSLANQSGTVPIFTSVGAGDPVQNDVPELATNLIDQDIVMDYGRVHAVGGVIQSNTDLQQSYVPGFNQVPGLRDILQSANNRKTDTEFVVLMRVSRA